MSKINFIEMIVCKGTDLIHALLSGILFVSYFFSDSIMTDFMIGFVEIVTTTGTFKGGVLFYVKAFIENKYACAFVVKNLYTLARFAACIAV